eukprot:EG_transcript_10388
MQPRRDRTASSTFIGHGRDKPTDEPASIAVPQFDGWASYQRTPLEEALHVTRPASGDSRCTGQGHWVTGTHPYCECFAGFQGRRCENAASLSLPLKACVVFLMYGSEKFAHELASVLPNLDRYFNDRYHYPVVVFHSKAFSRPTTCNATTSRTYLDLVRRSTRSEVIFEEVHLDFRPEMRAKFGDKGPKSTCTYRKYSLEYYHMCRFFDYLMFQSKVLRQFDYVWRMDGNIALSRPLLCDPFALMRDVNALYGFYRWDFQEPKGCTGPIRDFALRYSASHNFTAAHLEYVGTGEKAPRLYLGAWGVFKWSFFTSGSWLDFVEAVDVHGFAYLHRLGEQVLYAHALALLIPASAIHQFGGASPLIHRRQPIWPYGEWGVRRRDPFCEWRARHLPWVSAPPPAMPAAWAETWPEKKVMDRLRDEARRDEARHTSPCV